MHRIFGAVGRGIIVGLVGWNLASTAYADNHDIYTPLDQPCRVLDTRVAGSVGKLSSGGGNYTFGVTDAAITAAYQSGNAAGCGVPPGATGVAATFNLLNTTAAGDIRVWSTAAGTTGPSAGSVVYNLSANAPAAGQVYFNGGAGNIAVNPADGTFFLHVDNGALNATINVVGYFLPATHVKNMTLASPGYTSMVSFKVINDPSYDPVVYPVFGKSSTAGGLIHYTIYASDGASQIATEHGTIQYDATQNSITCTVNVDDKLHLGTVNSGCTPGFFNPGSQPGVSIFDNVAFSSPAPIARHYVYFTVEEQSGARIRYEP